MIKTARNSSKRVNLSPKIREFLEFMGTKIFLTGGYGFISRRQGNLWVQIEI
jgi:hypothetical protein